MHHATYIILSPNTPFFLHLPFWANASESLKHLRPQFLPFFRFNTLKSKEFWKRFCYRQLYFVTYNPQLIAIRRIDNSTLQNMVFPPVFAHFFDIDFS